MGRDWVSPRSLPPAASSRQNCMSLLSKCSNDFRTLSGCNLCFGFGLLQAAKKTGSFSSSGFKVCLPDDWVSCKKRANFVVRLNLYRSRVRWSFPELRNSIARDGKNFKRELPSDSVVEGRVATVTFQEEINYNLSQQRIIIWCSRGLIFKEHKFRPPWQWYSND